MTEKKTERKKMTLPDLQAMKQDELSSAPQEDLAKENECLRREVRLLKEEGDLLKKATVFFAEQSK